MRRFGKLLWAGLLGLCVGCGTSLTTLTTFPYALRGPNGEQLKLDDLRAIARDDTLSDDEKRAEFRDLGIEDEDLIDALLTL